MASSSSFSSLPLDSPSFPLTPLAHPLPSASSSSNETSSSPRIPVSSYPALPSSGPSTPSISPPPSSASTTTSFPGYTPLNDPPLPKSSKAKGKAREVQQNDGWIDLERGGQQHGGLGGTGGRQLDSRGEDDEGEHMVRSGWERIEELTIHEGGEGDDQARSYPPMTEDEREEKRIADTLALWKERDLAKRRAARESKQLKSSGGSRSSGSLSSMPSMRLPGGGGPSKRWSIWSGGESPNPSPHHNATTFLPTHTSSQAPASSSSPTSNANVPTSFSSSSSPSTFQPGHKPNMSTASADYEYRGREWMGGATKAPRRRRAEVGFWENLCGTGRNDRAPGENIEDGSDDDDGDQAGRTNPFE